MGLVVLTPEEWLAVATLREKHPDALGVSIEWSPRTDRTLASIEMPGGELRDYEIDDEVAVLVGSWRRIVVPA